jgi:hypothetical protein
MLKPRSRLPDRKSLRFESLEERQLLAGLYPNDPGLSQQWAPHNTGQTGGVVDRDVYAPEGGQLNAANALGIVQTIPATKFYVVNDGSPDRTYEYSPEGALVENYSLNSGNAAPRGAASTAAGDKVWVVDANRTVYVYNAAGVVLGSWTAGSIASNAAVEGIATNGTDVWIVDARSDKVFKYFRAASRMSGSQNASGSFSLNSGNRSPKDIVTNGTHLWVVDDSSANKVFKYTLAGQLVGSWKITGANTTPTGITIDPANVSDIWIVDSGTDRVYQYNGAANRTSGSQIAATSFALDPGNTNPQGIADPPAGFEVASPLAGPFSTANTGIGGQTAPKSRPSHSSAASLRGTDHIDLLLSEERGPAARPGFFRLWHSLSESNDDVATDAAFADLDATSDSTLESVFALLATG